MERLRAALLEVDATATSDDEMIALLEVLHVRAPERVRVDRGLAARLTKWILADVEAHRKTVFDLRMSLPPSALPRPKSLLAQVEKEMTGFFQVFEVGLPEEWDARKLVEMTRVDRTAKPWLTALERLRRLKRPPRDCLHATEPGAFQARVLWSFPDREETFDVAAFCFPDGVRLRTAADEHSFVFQVTLGDEKCYGVCVVDCRRIEDVFVPRCFCLLSRLPALELHVTLLRHAVKSSDGDRDKVRDSCRSGFIYERSRGLLDDIVSLRKVPDDMKWTVKQYDTLDDTASWSVPLFFESLAARHIVRLIAAALCELQIVMLSSVPGPAAAASTALAALLRPVLWVAPLVPVLPTQLHSILDAPTPYLVGTPRTPPWLDCVANRLPREGLVVVDLDASHIAFHPKDADFLDLPNADALLTALKPALDDLKVDRADASRRAQSSIARHIVRLCRVAISLRDEEPRPPTRARESVEFAALLSAEAASDRRLTSAHALRTSIDKSFLDLNSSTVLRRSTELLRDNNYLHPLTSAFFDRIADSQGFAVFRATFPDFPGLTVQERLALRTNNRPTSPVVRTKQSVASSLELFTPSPLHVPLS